MNHSLLKRLPSTRLVSYASRYLASWGSKHRQSSGGSESGMKLSKWTALGGGNSLPRENASEERSGRTVGFSSEDFEMVSAPPNALKKEEFRPTVTRDLV